MKVVILAGGFGTRIFEESRYKPKPMIEIGGKPILWHIMKSYAAYGFNDFIICAGYKQEFIKQWFANYYLNSSDVILDFSNGSDSVAFANSTCEPWRITIVDTGLGTMTGGRIKRVQQYIGNESFMMTYGDGVCDVDLKKLLEFHNSHNKIATLTTVFQHQEKGVIDIDEYGAVRSFREKQSKDGFTINAGFMVLEPEIFNYIEGDSTVFEQEPLKRLAAEDQLMSYTHTGFWQCMDTLREKEILESLWSKGNAPWKNW